MRKKYSIIYLIIFHFAIDIPPIGWYNKSIKRNKTRHPGSRVERLKMSKRFYAVQVGDDFASDNGSTVKRTALRMARALAKKNPGQEVRIAYCSTDSDYCENEEIVQHGER